jgi:hypothetical protein
MDIFNGIGDEPYKISFSEAVRFFKAVTSPGPCPMCGSVSWQIPIHTQESPVTLVASGMYDADGKPQYELKLSCNTCGFHRAHDARRIRLWLDSNPAEGETSDE